MKDNFIRFIILSLHIIIVLSYINNDLIINNGDYYRITKILNINIPAWTHQESTIFIINKGIDSVNNIPHFTLELIAGVVGNYNSVLNKTSIDVLEIRYVLYTIYLLGIILIIFKKDINFFYSIVIIPISIVYLYILNSLYQESVVYAFLPLFIYSSYKKSKYLFTIISIFILLSKPQMVLIFPFIMVVILMSKTSISLKIIQSIIIFGILLIPFYFTPKGNIVANRYNRFYNGIGYSVQNVGSWSVLNFEDRLNYFTKNRLDLQQKSKGYYDNDNNSLAGSSYYQDGEKLNSDGIKYKKQLYYYTSNMNYVQTFIKNKDLIYKITKGSYLTALKADYTIKYLNNNGCLGIINILKFYLSKFFFLFFLSILVFIGFLYRNILTFFYTVGIMFILPLVVVIGDGYYEFEKHLMPYLVLLPFYVRILSLLNQTFSVRLRNRFDTIVNSM